jgi:hypothetical protein
LKNERRIFMGNNKNSSSKDTGKSNNPSIVSDYKYIPGADTPKSEVAENKRPSSGNIKGV